MCSANTFLLLYLSPPIPYTPLPPLPTPAATDEINTGMHMQTACERYLRLSHNEHQWYSRPERCRLGNTLCGTGSLWFLVPRLFLEVTLDDNLCSWRKEVCYWLGDLSLNEGATL